MPTVSIYVRKEDYKTWEAIKDKSEFLHRILEAARKKNEPTYTQPEATA